MNTPLKTKICGSPCIFSRGLASLGCDLHWLLTGIASPSAEQAEKFAAAASRDEIASLRGQVQALQSTISRMSADHTAAIERIYTETLQRERQPQPRAARRAVGDPSDSARQAGVGDAARLTDVEHTSKSSNVITH